MRAKEFTINVPITISINGDDDPVINAGQKDSADSSELDLNPVMITPQQQELELKKAELGKESPVIDKLTAPNNIGAEPDEQTKLLDRIKQLMAR